MAEDPNAGVRRELILAFRNLPTDLVGGSLRKMAAEWDGQDRWYLEALGLALEKRESDFLSVLFDGSLYGALELDKTGTGAASHCHLISRLIGMRHSSQREQRIGRLRASASIWG